MKPREGSSAQIREGQDFRGGDQMPAAIRLWEREKHAEGQHRGCSGSTELEIVVSRGSWGEISLWKLGTLQH